MLSNYVTNVQTLERLRSGSSGVHLEGFTKWLASRQYSKETIRSYVFAASRFMNWCASSNDCEIPQMPSHAGLEAYRVYLSRTNQAGKQMRDGGNGNCGARRFLLFLCDAGLVPQSGQLIPPLELRFRSWMHQHRGACDSTLAGYCRVIRLFLEVMGVEPRLYTAAQLRAFVLTQTHGYSRSKADTVVTAIRMFVRFLIAYQECADALQHAIPRVAGWRQDSLPRYLDPADIERIIGGCDQSQPLGARDRAVLLLLARLGLRAGDVASLCLEDVDWAQGRLQVSGKSRRVDWLPLPQDAGDAMLHYLTTARPAVGGSAIFLIERAPYTPIKPKQVSSTAERALRGAGVQSPSLGAHLFRHSAATAWLRQGMSLQAIGAVLRHRDVDTTALYAKVDVELLRQIAQPWPVEVTPC